MIHRSTQRARAGGAIVAALATLAVTLSQVSCSSEVTGPSDLEGVWRLVSMEPATAPAFVPTNPARFTVEFGADRQIFVVADCNQCAGSYSLSGASLVVPALTCTLIACPTPEGGRFASLIEGTSSVERDGDDGLEIESSDGELSLRR
jgi:heat shock protein HslJ